MGDSQPRKLEEHIAHEVLLMVAMAALALLQTILLSTSLYFPPALLLVLVVCRVLVAMGSAMPEHELGQAMRWAFYGGIALDICAATPLGSHALALLLAAILVTFFARRLRIGSVLLPLIAVLLGSLVYELTLALLYQATVAPLDWSRYAVVILLPSVLLALIPTLPLFHLLRWRYET